VIASVSETLLPSVAVFLRGHLKSGRYLFWFFRSEEVVTTVCCDSDGFPELLSVFCGVFFVWVVRLFFAFQVLRFPFSFPSFLTPFYRVPFRSCSWFSGRGQVVYVSLPSSPSLLASLLLETGDCRMALAWCFCRKAGDLKVYP
jgi:hypothetical protein